MKWFVVDKRMWNTGLQYLGTRVSRFEYSQWLLTWAAILREKFINATNTNVVTQATIRAPCCGWFFPLCRRILLARYHVSALGPMGVQHCCLPPDVFPVRDGAVPAFFFYFSEDDWGCTISSAVNNRDAWKLQEYMRCVCVCAYSEGEEAQTFAYPFRVVVRKRYLCNGLACTHFQMEISKNSS